MDTAAFAQDEVLSNANFYCDSDSTVFFLQPYDYNVYRLSQTHHLTIPYRFVFPSSSSLPDDFTSNRIYKGKRVKMRADKIDVGNLFFTVGNTAAFQLLGSSFELLAYNIRSGMLYSVRHLMPDASSYFLPLGKGTVYGSDEQAVYGSVSSLDMFYAAKKIQNKKSWQKKLPQALQKYFEKSNQYANPVINILYFKQ